MIVSYIIYMAIGVGVLLGGAVLFAFSISSAATLYTIQHAYPAGYSIANWVAARRNAIPFVLFMLFIIVITLVLYMTARQVDHFTATIAGILLIFLLASELIIFSVGMWLATIVWIAGLIHWAFAGFRKVLWRAIRGKHAPELVPLRVKSSYRGRQRVESPYPLVPPTEEKAEQKAKAKARAKAQAKAQAIQKARAKELAKAQAIERARAKELAKAQANAKARAKELAEAQAKAKPKKTRSEETIKPKVKRRRRPRPRPGQKQ